ncbi:MAG: NAD-dependent epimerase/dehydratase family protein [Opitutales bacterium]
MMNLLKNCKLLIVGGGGFVGSNLCKKLLLDYDPKEIVVVDNFISSEITNLPEDSRLTVISESITDDGVLSSLPADLRYVFHLSCYHGNQSSIHSPLEDHANNLLTSLKLFERLKGLRGLEKVVYSAAGCAVAQKTKFQAEATMEEAPVSLFHDSPYSISKLVGEMYGNYYYTHCEMPFVKARFQNVYGPGEILGAGMWRGTPHTVWRNVTPSFIWKALYKEALPLDNGGVATRDFIYVDDIVEGLIACALKGIPGEAYNLASGDETSIREWAEMICEITSNPTPFVSKPARSWDNSIKRYGSTSKSMNELNFSAKVNKVEGLKKTIEWTKKNRERILSSMLKHLDELPDLEAYSRGAL